MSVEKEWIPGLTLGGMLEQMLCAWWEAGDAWANAVCLRQAALWKRHLLPLSGVAIAFSPMRVCIGEQISDPSWLLFLLCGRGGVWAGLPSLASLTAFPWQLFCSWGVADPHPLTLSFALVPSLVGFLFLLPWRGRDRQRCEAGPGSLSSLWGGWSWQLGLVSGSGVETAQGRGILLLSPMAIPLAETGAVEPGSAFLIN